LVQFIFAEEDLAACCRKSLYFDLDRLGSAGTEKIVAITRGVSSPPDSLSLAPCGAGVPARRLGLAFAAHRD